MTIAPILNVMLEEWTMGQITTSHETIRNWAAKHGGKPAAVASTHDDGDVGIIRIMFPESKQSEHSGLQEISWDEFFEEFDTRGLALLYEEDSLFSKIVSREKTKGSRKS